MAPDQRKYSIHILIGESVSILTLHTGACGTLRQTHNKIPTLENYLPTRTSERGRPGENPYWRPCETLLSLMTPTFSQEAIFLRIIMAALPQGGDDYVQTHGNSYTAATRKEIKP